VSFVDLKNTLRYRGHCEAILLRVLVTNGEGSELDERVYLLLIHTTSNYTYLEHYLYFYTLYFTVTHMLIVS
jgi:hypothetical protein